MFRKIIAAVVLLFMLFASASAQDKYEYCMVRLATGMLGSYDGIWIAYAGKDWQQDVKLDKKDLKGVLYTNCGPILDYLQKMNEKGWEIYGTNLSDQLYFLRKKKD